MKRLAPLCAILLLLSVATAAVITQSDSTPAGYMALLTWGHQSNAPDAGRVLVSIEGSIDETRLGELAAFGRVHQVIERFGLVAITPHGKRERASLAQLRYVRSIESDQPRYPAQGAASWDRDILDVHDVEENGSVSDPDAREVAQTGAGVHVAVIDSGLVKNWRDVLIESRVRTDLARAFMGGGATDENFVPGPSANISNPTNLWERDTSSHGYRGGAADDPRHGRAGAVPAVGGRPASGGVHLRRLRAAGPALNAR